MTALSTVPSKFRSVPSIERLGDSLDRARQNNRTLRQRAEGAVDLTTATVATGLGAALCGYAMGKGYSEGVIGAAGGGLVVLGVVMKQTALVHAGNGVLAPLVAGMAAKYAAGAGAGASKLGA